MMNYRQLFYVRCYINTFVESGISIHNIKFENANLSIYVSMIHDWIGVGVITVLDDLLLCVSMYVKHVGLSCTVDKDPIVLIP